MIKFTAVLALLIGPMDAPQDTTATDPFYKIGSGGVNVCDLAAPSMAAFAKQLESDPTFEEQEGDREYRVFLREDEGRLRQVVVERNPERSGMATCRDIVRDETGALQSRRSMSCFYARPTCDEIFLSFKTLDEALTRMFSEH